MDKIQFLNDIEKNINNYRTLDEKNAMLMIALYQKTIEEIKSKKISEINNYFSNQLKNYNKNNDENQKLVNDLIKEYSSQIDGLVEAYDYLYNLAFNKMQQAINNQIIAIGNMVIVWEKINLATEEEKKNLNKQLIALAQKKINYSVIIDECKARLNWCIKNVQKDLNEIFSNNFSQIVVYKNGFWDKLKRKIISWLYGNKEFIDNINSYKNTILKQIEKNNKLKMIEIIATAKGFEKQVKTVERQIKLQYEEMIQEPQNIDKMG